MRRFRTLVVRKIISSMASLSMIVHWASFPRPEELFQHRRVAGIVELSIQIVADEIKEGFEDGIPGMLG